MHSSFVLIGCFIFTLQRLLNGYIRPECDENHWNLPKIKTMKRFLTAGSEDSRKSLASRRVRVRGTIYRMHPFGGNEVTHASLDSDNTRVYLVPG